MGVPLGSVTIFIWFVFPLIPFQPLLSSSVHLFCQGKLREGSDYLVARQHWPCGCTQHWIQGFVFWLGHCLLLPVSFPLVSSSSWSCAFSPLLLHPFSTPILFSPLCLYDCTVEASAPGRWAVPVASRSRSSREHLSKPRSVMTTQQWGNWADPEAKAVRGDWWEGQRGQAILVPPT